jgi:hypothetical protein
VGLLFVERARGDGRVDEALIEGRGGMLPTSDPVAVDWLKKFDERATNVDRGL